MKNNQGTGVLRRVDDLGRIVLPKEYRRAMHINENDPLEIILCDNQIHIHKYHPLKTIQSLCKQYLRAFAQKDPVVEYRVEGFDMFEEMNESIKEDTVKTLLMIEIRQNMEREQVAKPTVANVGGDDSIKKQPTKVDKKPGRNDPCPCGSGKKYKKCCGAND